MAASVAAPAGSALARTEELSTKGSCGIAIMRVRITSRGRVRRSMPSMKMVPESSSRRRKRVSRSELLPLFHVTKVSSGIRLRFRPAYLPVRPQIPIF